MIKYRNAIVLAALLTLGSAATAQVTYLNHEHVDLEIGYSGNQWNLHLHDGDHDIAYSPDEARLGVWVPDSRYTRPTSSAYDFIGVGPGEAYYRLPLIQNPDQLYLGLGAQFLSPGDIVEPWDPNDPRLFPGEWEWLRLNLVDVDGPGAFSAWTEDGGPVAWMASSDGINTDDALYILAGGHAHLNWGFAAYGRYELLFTATARLAGQGLSTSVPVSFTFMVARHGDADLSGFIDEADLAWLADGWKIEPPTGAPYDWAQGDFTGDGVINEADLAYLADGWKQPMHPSALPEPTALAMMLVGSSMLSLRR